MAWPGAALFAALAGRVGAFLYRRFRKWVPDPAQVRDHVDAVFTFVSMKFEGQRVANIRMSNPTPNPNPNPNPNSSPNLSLTLTLTLTLALALALTRSRTSACSRASTSSPRAPSCPTATR